MTITQITTQLTSHVTNRHYQHISNYRKWMDKPIGFWYFLEALSVTVCQSWLSVSTQREKSCLFQLCLFQLCNIQTLLNICKRKPWNSAVAKYGFFKHSSTDMQTFKYANRTCINTKGNIYNIHVGGPDYTHFQTITTILAVHIALTLLLTHLKLGAF